MYYEDTLLFALAKYSTLKKEGVAIIPLVTYKTPLLRRRAYKTPSVRRTAL